MENDKKLNDLVETVTILRNKGNLYIEDVKNLSALISEKSQVLESLSRLEVDINKIKEKYSEDDFIQLLDCCQEVIINEAKRKAKSEVNLSDGMLDLISKKIIK